MTINGLDALYEKTKDISSDELAKDIADTASEVRMLETRARVLRMELSVMEDGIRERNAFVAKLRALREYREELEAVR